MFCKLPREKGTQSCIVWSQKIDQLISFVILILLKLENEFHLRFDQFFSYFLYFSRAVSIFSKFKKLEASKLVFRWHFLIFFSAWLNCAGTHAQRASVPSMVKEKSSYFTFSSCCPRSA